MQCNHFVSFCPGIQGWEYGGGSLHGIVGHFQIFNYIIEIFAPSSLLLFFLCNKKENTYELKSEKNSFMFRQC